MVTSNIKMIIGKYASLHRNLTRRVMEAEAGVMGHLLRQGFRDQIDPYGNKWEKNNDGSRFDRAGTIQKSFKTSYTDDSAKIESDLDFAIFHQTGTKRLPQRRMIPDEAGGGLEHSTWQAPMHLVLSKVVKRIMSNS